MKKYAILTSVLAVAACGGGSGGSGGVVGGRVMPTRLAISDITEMDAAIVDKASVVNIVKARLGTTPESYDQALEQIDNAKQILRTLDKTEITDENLDNVIMAMKLAGYGWKVPDDANVEAVQDVIVEIKDSLITGIDAIVSDATKTIDDVKFNIVTPDNKGTLGNGVLYVKTKGSNITAIRLLYGDDENKPDKTVTMIPMGGNKFKQITGGAYIDDVAEGELVMFGKNQKLKYADFGYFDSTSIKDDKTIVSRDYFAGGYDFLVHIDKKELSGQTMTFTGTAVASMFDGNTASRKDMQDDAATLTFNNGAETLNMHFDDWYGVKLSNGGIEFTGDVEAPFAFTTAASPVQDNVVFQTDYYGDSAPTEAVARFGYVEGDKAFTGAFGGKID